MKNKEDSKINATFISAVLLGLLITLSISSIIYVSFGKEFVKEISGNGLQSMMITPLGFDLALLLIIMISAIILIASTKEKKSRRK